MTRRQLGWAAAVCVGMALPAAAVGGEDPWWIVPPRRAGASDASVPAVSLGRPIPLASLDRPIPVPEPAWNPQAAPADAGWNAPTPPDAGPGWNAPTAGPVSLAPPAPEVMPIGYDPAPGALLEPRVARGQPPDPAPPGALVGPPPAPPAPDGGYNTGVAVDQPLHHPFLDGCHEWFNFGSRPSNGCGELFKSDRFCDDALISPVTNPFFFEDPRSLTEVVPLFIVQKNQKSDGGGNSEFYGVQARLALNEQWSIVMNKLGVVSLNPSDPIDGYDKKTGFAEVDIGPKWTFYRNECSRSAAAVGLTLELPVGSSDVHQNTGTLGLDPYITYGQTFGRTSYGSFDFIGEAGLFLRARTTSGRNSSTPACTWITTWPIYTAFIRFSK